MTAITRALIRLRAAQDRAAQKPTKRNLDLLARAERNYQAIERRANE